MITLPFVFLRSCGKYITILPKKREKKITKLNPHGFSKKSRFVVFGFLLSNFLLTKATLHQFVYSFCELHFHTLKVETFPENKENNQKYRQQGKQI